jgi:hypothetical protein
MLGSAVSLAMAANGEGVGKINWIVENPYQEGFNVDLDDGKLDAIVYLEREGNNVYYDLWVEADLDWFEMGAGVIREDIWIDIDVWDWSSQSYEDFEYILTRAYLLDRHNSAQKDGTKSAPSEYFRIKVCEGEYIWSAESKEDAENETANKTVRPMLWVEWCEIRYVKLE